MLLSRVEFIREELMSKIGASGLIDAGTGAARLH